MANTCVTPNAPLVPPCGECRYLVASGGRPYCTKGATSDQCADFSCFRPRSLPVKALVSIQPYCPCGLALRNEGPWRSTDTQTVVCVCGVRVNARFWEQQR